jgi:DNA-binding transcriptional MerR regulator
MYYSIGEFSKLTNLTQKTLRLYQEKELLIPAKIDEFTKYRFYNDSNLETANLINFFKQFDFSLAEIKEIVDNQDDRSIVAELLEKQRDVIEDKITKYNFVMGLINEKLKRRNTMTEMISASKQRSRFWKIFAKLLMSNIPIAESLEIAGKSADEETKAVLSEIINDVKQGNKLH